MKIIRRKVAKTQASDQQLKSQGRTTQSWLLPQTISQKVTPRTVMRFACVNLKNKQGHKLAANHRESLQKNSINKTAKTDISETVDILKSLWKEPEDTEEEEYKYVTPFSLDIDNILEEELSFRGVANKQQLKQTINLMEIELGCLLALAQKLGQTYLEACPNNSLQRPNAQSNSSPQVLRHAQQLKTSINEFRTEYSRCLSIIQAIPGIADKSLTFYQSRFSRIVSKLKDKWKFMQKYIFLTTESYNGKISSMNTRIGSQFDAQ